MTIYAGPERYFDEFYNKSKKSTKKKSTNDDDVYYIHETGLISPPEINFFYNPALRLDQNLKEYEQNKHKINHELMFSNCSVFERWLFEQSSKTK